MTDTTFISRQVEDKSSFLYNLIRTKAKEQGVTNWWTETFKVNPSLLNFYQRHFNSVMETPIVVPGFDDAYWTALGTLSNLSPLSFTTVLPTQGVRKPSFFTSGKTYRIEAVGAVNAQLWMGFSPVEEAKFVGSGTWERTTLSTETQIKILSVAGGPVSYESLTITEI